jgi:hypothetical protein
MVSVKCRSYGDWYRSNQRSHVHTFTRSHVHKFTRSHIYSHIKLFLSLFNRRSSLFSYGMLVRVFPYSHIVTLWIGRLIHCVNNTLKEDTFAYPNPTFATLDESADVSSGYTQFETVRAGIDTTSTLKRSGTSSGICHGTTQLQDS